MFSVEQAFVGRDEKRAPLKTPSWEARSWGATSVFIVLLVIFQYGLLVIKTNLW